METDKREDTNDEEAKVRKEPVTIKIDAKTAAIIGGFVVILALGFAFRGFVVAASVNGSPISRISVVQELERQGGKAALDALITEKLIEGEAASKGITVSEDELNAELKKIEDQVTAQGGTLADALAQQGLTEEVLRKQVRLQIKVEKLLADKIAVTNEEVETFITENKLPLPTTDAEAAREMVRDQLKDQKMQQGAQALVEGLRSSAKIKYYTNY